MNLPKFEPAYWVVDTYRFPTNEKDMRRTSNQVMSTDYFETEDEAFDFARKSTREYEVLSYKGEVREATPRDQAMQRLRQIADAIAIDLDNTLQKEEEILAYDTWEYGKIDYKTDILNAVTDVLDCYPPEEPYYEYP